MTLVLMLGGIADGKTTERADAAHGARFEMREYLRLDATVDAPPPETCAYSQTLYRIVEFRCGLESRFVAIPDDERDEWALLRLFGGYGRR